MFVNNPADILNLFSHSLVRFNHSLHPRHGTGEGAVLLNFEMLAGLFDPGHGEVLKGQEKGSPIKRTEVKKEFSCGPENQVFSPRKKLGNTTDFFVFCLSRNINVAMSAYSAAPVTHQDLGCQSSPTVLRRPDNLRSHAMSKCCYKSHGCEPTRCWLMPWSAKQSHPKSWKRWLPIKSGGYANPIAGSPLPPNL
jgi:hypothetical protein